MAAAKKATKAVTKRAKTTDDGIYYIVMERKMFGVEAIELFKTRTAAQLKAEFLDNVSGYTFNKYIVQRVEHRGD